MPLHQVGSDQVLKHVLLLFLTNSDNSHHHQGSSSEKSSALRSQARFQQVVVTNDSVVAGIREGNKPSPTYETSYSLPHMTSGLSP